MDLLEDGHVIPQTSFKTHPKFNTRTNPKHSLNSSSRIDSSTPPFRVGGRGSKQLSKAIEKSCLERGQAGDAHSEPQWAFCLGKQPCFAKILSEYNPSQPSKSVIIQPMFSNDQDPHLFTLWEGHLWMAKCDKIYIVKMKQEIGGWRLQLTRELQSLLEQYSTPPGSLLALPSSLGSARSSGDNWDLVSLESTDLDDCSSVNSSMIFPMLEKNSNDSKKDSKSNKGESSAVEKGRTDKAGLSSEDSSSRCCSCGNLSRQLPQKLSDSESRKLTSPQTCKGTPGGSIKHSSGPRFSCAVGNKTPSPRVQPDTYGGTLSTGMSGSRKASVGSGNPCISSYRHGHNLHHKSQNCNRNSPVNVPRVQSSPTSCGKDVENVIAKQMMPSATTVTGMRCRSASPSPALSITPPTSYSDVIMRPRTHPESSPSIDSGGTLTSPLPYPRRCQNFVRRSVVDKTSENCFSGSSLHSPTASVASSSLSPCVLPCPSSAGSTKSSHSICYNRSDSTAEKEVCQVADGSGFSFRLGDNSSSFVDSERTSPSQDFLSQSSTPDQNIEQESFSQIDKIESDSIDDQHHFDTSNGLHSLKRGIAFYENNNTTSCSSSCGDHGSDTDIPPDVPNLDEELVLTSPALKIKQTSRVAEPPPLFSTKEHIDPHVKVPSKEDAKNEDELSKNCGVSVDNKSMKNSSATTVSSNVDKEDACMSSSDDTQTKIVTRKRQRPNIPRASNKKAKKGQMSSPASRRSVRSASSNITGGDTSPSRRPARRAASSPQVHRDAIFGSWPTRTQSASRGTWTL